MLDMDVIRELKISLGVDPLGGAGVHYWEPIADRYRFNLTVVNPTIDPTFRFMTVDWDGQILHGPIFALCDAAPDRTRKINSRSLLLAIRTMTGMGLSLAVPA